jgi:hypothetical protein
VIRKKIIRILDWQPKGAIIIHKHHLTAETVTKKQNSIRALVFYNDRYCPVVRFGKRCSGFDTIEW